MKELRYNQRMTMSKKMPYTIVSILILIVLYSCSKSKSLTQTEKDWLATRVDNDSITVALFPYYAPYQFFNEDEEMEGILIDYLTFIENEIEYKFRKKIYTDWIKLIKDAEEGKIDIILEIQQTAKRSTYLNFYSKLFESTQTIVTRKDQQYGIELKDFKGKTITTPAGYSITEILSKHEKYLTLIPNTDDLNCLIEVSEGKYDAYIGPRAVTNHLIKTENLDNLQIISEIDHRYTYSPSIAVQKNDKILNQIFSKVTKSITDEEMQVIYDNWLYNPIIPFYKKPYFWMIVTCIVLSILSIILFLNQYLKHLIREKTKELHIAKERAEESNKLKTSFIHNISHEVRTPMNGIIGFSELLNDPEITPSEQKEYSKIVRNSSKQLIHIIDSIIEISKLETNQVEAHFEEMNINSELEELFSDFGKKIKRKKIQFKLTNKIPNDKAVILMDKSKIHKILFNLIDNAIKFTKKGSVEIYSEISKSSNTIIISIKDTGIGIEPKDQELIFRNFSQSEKEVTKSYDGLGLGLSIALKNARLINGDISFDSTPNKGSCFILTIPYHPIFTNHQDGSEKKSASTNAPVKQVILIVEDGNVNFLFLKTLLLKMQEYKFVIHRAENGEEAVNICEKNDHIDLILMDIRMPIMDGYTATKKIKKIRPGIPIVAQTAYSTEEDVQKALNAGCDDFVSKPVDQKLLKPIINKYFSFLSK